MRRGLAFIAVAIIAVGVFITIRDRMRGYHTTYGSTIHGFTLHSKYVHRDLHELLVVPPRPHGHWLLILLHGRGSKPSSFLDQSFFDALHSLGRDAPVVFLPDGGDHSYWHDRKDGQWAKMFYGEAFPAARRRATVQRFALGGISMGGFGALRLGVVPVFCAVGGHSPALWFRGADTPAGAFDDAADFARWGNLLGRAAPYDAPVWIDVGTNDPFRKADVAFAHKIHAQLHVWPGGHDHSYWSAHMRSYFQFYARSCG